MNNEKIAEMFRACTQKTLEELCQAVFTKDAKVEQHDIIEYQSRMRVFGLEKFNDICYISLVNLFESPLEQEKNDTCGVIIVYVHEEHAERLFKGLLKGQEGEDDELLAECTKKLCQALFERFKNSVNAFGYTNIVGGEAENYRSNIEEGVDFPYMEDTLHQVSCSLWKEKVVMAELVLAPSLRG